MPSYTKFILPTLIFILPAARALDLKDINLDPKYNYNVAIGKKLDVRPGTGEVVDEDGRKYKYSCDNFRCDLKFVSGDIFDEADRNKDDKDKHLRPVCDSLRYDTSPTTIRGAIRHMGLLYKTLAQKFADEKKKYFKAVSEEHADPDRVFEREEMNRLRHTFLAKIELKVRAAAIELVAMQFVTKNFSDFSKFENLSNLGELSAHVDNLVEQSYVLQDADGALEKVLDPGFAVIEKDYVAGDTRCEHAHCLEGSACNVTMRRKLEDLP